MVHRGALQLLVLSRFDELPSLPEGNRLLPGHPFCHPGSLSRPPDLSAALADDAGSELARGKRHDRVLWKSRGGDRFTGEAGALDVYLGSHRELFPGRELTKQAFTFQMSDHLPLWVEVATR
ncbi:MAG: hypothetical protein EOO74_09145 [Myxococcales bacterium]|nr:MAG: hypothetical protein EOO74_09145 [Myxococcales bacterium]